MRKATRLGLIALVAVALTATACGSSREPSEQGNATTTTRAAAKDDKFGTLPSPCGDGDAAGATDQGVTDTSISIGYGDDKGFASSPGLDHEMGDAVKAFAKWCNDQGGILGRQVAANYYDAKVTEINNVMAEACRKEFMLVGQGFVLDSAQEVTRRSCGLPSVAGFAVSPQHTNAPLKWETNPVPVDYWNTAPAAQLKKLFPDKVAKTAIMWANYAATIDTKDKILSTWPPFGYKFLGCGLEYNITGEADWKPFVQKLKTCGAELVYFVGNPYPNFENLLEAAAQLDYDPVWSVTGNFYDRSFGDWNTSGFADNVYIGYTFTPFEEATDGSATRQYMDILKASGGDISQLGMEAASSFLMWATAAKECGSTLTRECVASHLDKVTSWDGGGLSPPTNPGENLPGECGMLLKMEGTKFVRVTPKKAGTFDCDPSFASKVTGPLLERAHLDANRHSQP
jgi:ABC-type branched-subunit amino acid transport system substrate-binding protein